MRLAACLALASAAVVLAGCGAEEVAAPTRAAAQVPAGPDGLLVLAALEPERAMVADPVSGRTLQRVLPGGTLCRGPVVAAGRRVLWIGDRGGEPVALSLPLTLSGRPRSLGRADRISVGADGEPLLRLSAAALPRNSVLEAVVADAVLITRGRDLVLWRGGRAVRSLRDGWVLASDGSRAAWCRGGCRSLTVWDGTREQSFTAPGSLIGSAGGRAALSSDGLRLAAVVSAGGRPRVGILDLTTGRWRVLRRERVTGYQALAWSPSGAWLYFTGARRRVRAWNADRGVRALPIRIHGRVITIETVPRPR